MDFGFRRRPKNNLWKKKSKKHPGLGKQPHGVPTDLISFQMAQATATTTSRTITPQKQKRKCQVKSIGIGQFHTDSHCISHSSNNNKNNNNAIRSSLVKSLAIGTIGGGGNPSSPHRRLTVSLSPNSSTARDPSWCTDTSSDSSRSNNNHSNRHPVPEEEFLDASSSLVEEASLGDFVTCCTSSPEMEDKEQRNAPKITRLSASFTTTGPSLDSLQEQQYWNTMVKNSIVTYEPMHRQTAEAYYRLGHAHLTLGDCAAAMNALNSACQITKAVEGPTHLSVGRALDAYGLAVLRYQKENSANKPSLSVAKKALDEAFAIRFHNLGVWHVDTVETYNKIASVYLHKGYLEKAAQAYKEVFLVRKAIFGPHHPSVAISAHSLANCHAKLFQRRQALEYFEMAAGIYEHMQLPPHHPTVARLLRDRNRLLKGSSGTIPPTITETRQPEESRSAR